MVQLYENVSSSYISTNRIGCFNHGVVTLHMFITAQLQYIPAHLGSDSYRHILGSVSYAAACLCSASSSAQNRLSCRTRWIWQTCAGTHILIALSR